MVRNTYCTALLMISGLLVLLSAEQSQAAPATRAQKPNVLFIAVDDLRPELGCYGVEDVHSPHIDALAASGMLFERAYCQQAVCSPSRTSLLLGKRPDTTGIYDLHTHFRKHLPDTVTLPQHFKAHGYHTQAMGKIYHGGLDDPASWSTASYQPRAQTYWNPETRESIRQRLEKLRESGRHGTEAVEKDPKTGLPLRLKRPPRVLGTSWEAPDVDDDQVRDGILATRAVETLEELAGKEQPFFLAVGFYKPHLPFVAPRKYYDLYEPARLRLAGNPEPPKNCPPIALTNWGELRGYSDIPRPGPLPDAKARELIHGYYACVSHIDAQIGRLLKALDRLKLRDNTIVILWGDHGWQLGEHGLWCKHTNFEVATHVPMILSVPGQPHRGGRTKALVEFVDIYPTLCALAGLPIPKDLEGISMAPLLEKPTHPWKTAAFSQYPRAGGMGYSIRTDRYRYTEWRDGEGKVTARELYDHQEDPAENVNRAGDPAQKGTLRDLERMLEAGWRGAAPNMLPEDVG